MAICTTEQADASHRQQRGMHVHPSKREGALLSTVWSDSLRRSAYVVVVFSMSPKKFGTGVVPVQKT